MAKRRRRRGGFGWSHEQHINAAEGHFLSATSHIREMYTNMDRGFCLAARDRLLAAANDIGAAACSLNASYPLDDANIVPRMQTEWRSALRAFEEARKRFGKSCVKG